MNMYMLIYKILFQKNYSYLYYFQYSTYIHNIRINLIKQNKLKL